MKPVYYGRRVTEGTVLHDYIKSSSYPLYPPFTKGLQIDHLRQMMEGENISRAHFISAQKIGSPGTVEIFGKDGKFKATVPEFRKAQSQLTRGGADPHRKPDE
jgi:hypothetical protein